jgi:hypothetical protein
MAARTHFTSFSQSTILLPKIEHFWFLGVGSSARLFSVPDSFGLDVDFAQLVKLYGDYGQHDSTSRYSPTTHGYQVRWDGKVFPDLPKHDSMQIGHVRKMVRHLGIDKDCARSFGCY